EFTVILAQVGTEEVNAVLDMRDPRLGVRTLEPPGREELLDQGIHRVLQECPRPARDDKIIGKPDHVDFRPLTALEPWECSLDMSFQAIQSQVHQDGRCYATLWHACRSRREDVLVHKTGGEPLSEDGLLHGDMGQ